MPKRKTIRDRVKKLRRVKASKLVPHPGNWRTHPKEQRDALRGLLAEIEGEVPSKSKGMVRQWRVKRETDHYLDGSYMADVGANICAITLLGASKTPVAVTGGWFDVQKKPQKGRWIKC